MTGGAAEVVALVPVRGLDNGKTRLAGVLPPASRGALTRAMLERVVCAALDSEAVDRVGVISPDSAALAFAAVIDRRVIPVAQSATTPGLNGAAAAGRAWATARGAGAVLILFADLPLLAGRDVRRLLESEGAVVIATDRHGTGTNALLLRLDGTTTGGEGPAGRFAFGFGEGSASRHAAEAARLGLASTTVQSPGTALDLDTPDDWLALLASGAWEAPAMVAAEQSRAGDPLPPVPAHAGGGARP